MMSQSPVPVGISLPNRGRNDRLLADRAQIMFGGACATYFEVELQMTTPKDKHERHKLLLVTNGSGASDMFFDSRWISRIYDFACAGDRHLQCLADCDLRVRCAS
jgi:hypothetical protein